MQWTDVIAELSGLAHLATVGPDGRPHVSVVAPGIDGETIWIGTRWSSRKARNLAATPLAALVWQPQAEIYVDADVELVDEIATKQRLWDGAVFPYDPTAFFGSVDDPDYLLLRLSPTSASIMEMTVDGPLQRRWQAPSTG